MTINNSNGLPSAADLEALANDFFPEFATPEVLGKVSALRETVRNTLQTKPGFSEEDILKEIPNELRVEHSRQIQADAAKQQDSLPFSFLEYADSVPTEAKAPFPEGAVIKNEAFYSSLSPGILTGLNQLEPENKAGHFRGLTIEPVLVSTVDNISSNHFDVHAVRRDFPILSEKVNGGKDLVWLDNAATTHKPKSVIDRLVYFYEHENSNVHRAAHEIAARSTDAYEGARDKVARFINAPSSKEIVFVRGATEAINLVACSWGKSNLQKDDEIIVSWLEHHANIVPWQMLCAETGAKLRVIPVDDTGQVILEAFEKLLNSRTKIVAVTHVSNALGTITPVAEIVKIAHRYGAKVLIDGAQAVSHLRVDVQALNCDFYVFSGHKVFGPTGIGVVYAKPEILNAMRPYQGGGNMIVDVTFEKTVYQVPPYRFEAGTGNIADAVGLGAAIDYVSKIGMDTINRYEHSLLEYGIDALKRIPGLRLIGTAKEKASVLSFVIEGYTTEEIGHTLSQEGIAVRSGHHCAQPILRRFGLETAVRPSLAFYNTFEEIDLLVSVLWRLKSGRNLY